MQPDVWTTRDGTKIPVAEMETSHLRNALRFIARKTVVLEEEAECALWLASTFSHSDYAGDLFEMAGTEAGQAQEGRHWVKTLHTEMSRRGLAADAQKILDEVNEETEGLLAKASAQAVAMEAIRPDNTCG